MNTNHAAIHKCLIVTIRVRETNDVLWPVFTNLLPRSKAPIN